MTLDNLEDRARELGRAVQEILKQFQQLHDAAVCGQYANLGHQDLRIIEYLGQQGRQMMRSLAEHLGLAVNSMTSLIDHLEQKGMALRTRSDVDRRVIHVELTGIGRQAFQEISNAKLQFHRALLSALTENEQEKLLDLFRKIAREGSKQVEQLSS